MSAFALVEQRPFIEAAAKVDVKRIIPSEFGSVNHLRAGDWVWKIADGLGLRGYHRPCDGEGSPILAI